MSVRRRGYSLIEMSAVILVLALVAAIALPRLSASLEANKIREYRRNVVGLFGEAREQAVRTGQTMVVAFDDGVFQIQRATDDTAEVTRTVARNESVNPENFQTDGAPVGDGQWQVSFYADGTSDGGAFELSESANTESIRILRRTGQVVKANGDLTTSEDPEGRWSAGENVPSS